MEKKIALKVIDISNSLAQANAYALLLQEAEGERQIPVIIGSVEAQAIAFKLKGFKSPRPFTHDLFVSFSQLFRVELTEVQIYKVVEGVFYSYLFFEQDGNIYRLDSRTSDAVALALRFDCPIYTTEAILRTESIRKEDGGKFSVPVSAVGIPVLREALKKAVSDENYELASQLHDEIRRREEQEKNESII